MSRVLRGYAVRSGLDGQWYDGGNAESTPCPWTDNTRKRHLFDEYQDACAYVLTYIASNNLRVVAVYSKPKPAPVEAGERYACLVEQDGTGVFFQDLRGGFQVREVASREEAVEASREWLQVATVVRILPDGAHEAAVKEAREQGRVEALADVRKRVTDATTAMRDIAIKSPGSTDAHRARQLGKVDGLLMAVGEIDTAAGFSR